ncbi:MAG TPA: endonuclease domain-containing protein [Elusimicrobiales bacterium]|nr:endonuclease domain-containing protein [Elusimicrobiales bacterium]
MYKKNAKSKNYEPLITKGYHLPYNPNLKEAARALRKNMTPAEKHIWFKYLSNFKYQVFKQRPISNYIVDFYCPKLKLIIEVDGDSHYFEKGQKLDVIRERALKKYGLKILRFTNKDVLTNLEGVVSVIEEIPPAPLKEGGTTKNYENNTI